MIKDYTSNNLNVKHKKSSWGYAWVSVIVMTGAIMLLFIPHIAYGHGLGTDSIQSINIDGQDISIYAEMTPRFENGVGYLTITAVDEKSQNNLKEVTLQIGIFHDGELVSRDFYYASDGVLLIKIQHGEYDDDFRIKGIVNSLFGAWYGTDDNPLQINSPNLVTGGLYTLEIEVKTMGSITNILEDTGIHRIHLSAVVEDTHVRVGADGDDHEFGTRSYFDKISSLKYDPNTKQILLEMPFDWNAEHLSHVPLVRNDVYFAKNFMELSSPGYVGYVNGIALSASSVIVDDHTEEDKRTIHIVLTQDHLQELRDELDGSYGEKVLPESITFALSAGGDTGFPRTAQSDGGSYELNLSWDPANVETGVVTNFIFIIRDRLNGGTLDNSNYTFVIMWNGEEIHRVDGATTTGGAGIETFAFTEDQRGPMIVKFEDIRNTGQVAEFGMVVSGYDVDVVVDDDDIVPKSAAVEEKEAVSESVGADGLSLEQRTIYEKSLDLQSLERLQKENHDLKQLVYNLKAQLQKILGQLASIEK